MGADHVFVGTDYPFDMGLYDPVGQIAESGPWATTTARRSTAGPRPACSGSTAERGRGRDRRSARRPGLVGPNIAGLVEGSDRLRVVVAVDPDPVGRRAAEADGLRTTDSLDEALRTDGGVDAVVLCSPHRFHVEQIVAAARASKHVFCEKPFSARAAEADRALQAVQEAGVQLGIGHERRFEPAVVELSDRALGDLGVPLAFEGNFSQDKFLALPPDNWRLSASTPRSGRCRRPGSTWWTWRSPCWGRRECGAAGDPGDRFANGDTLTVTLTSPAVGPP